MGPSVRSAAMTDDLRLSALKRYGILDTPAEQGFDDIVLLASRLCQTPVALVSLVADDRQWFKARVGFDACQTPLSQSVCAYTMRQSGLLIIPDLATDPRTRDNLLVVQAPHIRFYAGARLETPEGEALGALCVIDTQPRPGGLTPDQASSLEALARQVMVLMELRRSMISRDAAVLASDTRQRGVFDMTRQLIAVVALDGVVLEVNRAALEAIGFERAGVVGHPFWETPWFTQTPGMSEVVKEAVGAARRGQRVRTEMSLIMPDGSTRIYDFTMYPVRDAGGNIVEVMPEASDITDLRKAEEALRQSQKMEAVGQLTGGLAHDFNNLLAGISGCLELMETRIQQGRVEDIERYINAAQGASKRAAALTHRLLAFSRRQTLAPEPTNVDLLVSGMEEMIRRTAGPALVIEVVGASGLWPALVDQSQLENALLNLCINARDAMPDGGRITIETANKWLDEKAARKQGIPAGQYVSLRVTDTGVGMPPEIITRVFEPFFTTKPIGEGTGLGLSMVYGFAQQSGGQVRINSEVGRGTTVCIYLPRHDGEVKDDTASETIEVSPPLNQGETVLVVDDEPTVRMLVTDILDDLGYLALEAGDSAAGLKILQSDVRIDLLVTDIGLPGGMNGRQMAEVGRVKHPDLKVLFITGYA
jgi:PAS domain S-box-containing protein